MSSSSSAAEVELPAKSKPCLGPVLLSDSKTPPALASATPALVSGSAYPNAFDVAQQGESLEFRVNIRGADEEEGGDSSEQMSSSLTRSQKSPFQMTAKSAVADAASASAEKEHAESSSSLSSSSSAAAIAGCGVSFSWTRGEMIGRGGFGVVCATIFHF